MSWNRTIDDALDDADYILEAVRDVRDPEVETSEYDFLDNLEKVHPAPSKKGNDGLANVVAELAIYRENNELKIDQELIEEADTRLSEEHDSYRPRKRINNIIQDSDSRGKSKMSMEYNISKKDKPEPDGHERLLDRVFELYKASGREDEGREKIQNIFEGSDLLLDNTNLEICDLSKSVQSLDGGEIMTNIEEMAGEIEESVDEMYEMLDSLPGEDTYDELRSDLDELKDKAEAARDDYFEVKDGLSEAHSELETVYDSLESAHERVGDASEYVDRVATATGHALDDAVSEMESALDEGVDQVDEAQGYMEEILDDDVPDMPDRPDRVEEQLG